MAVDVSVLRVFTDDGGRFGNPLGVADAAAVAPRDRQRVATELGYSETIFVDLPKPGSKTANAYIFTPEVELPFAGHPTVGAGWWLRRRGTPVQSLHVPAGPVRIGEAGGLTTVRARAEWSPQFVVHELSRPDDVLAAEPSDYAGDGYHYVWAWVDRDDGHIRSRMFANEMGVPEDEATGSAAVRMTDQLGRDLRVTQGRGSQILTRWDPSGWVEIAGRVVDDGGRQLP